MFLLHPPSLLVLVNLYPGLHIPDKDFSAGAAVAVRLVVIQLDLVVLAHLV